MKVLDFGLAKAFTNEASSEDIGNSPTLSMAATMQGVILGTAAYMSPEQAKGKQVDKRTDILAFGCGALRTADGQPGIPRRRRRGHSGYSGKDGTRTGTDSPPIRRHPFADCCGDA